MTYNRCMAKRDDDLEFSVNAAFDEARAVIDKVPLYLVNGSLGSGKTSVLEFLLQQSDYKGARVIENEYANENVDGYRLEGLAEMVTTLAGDCVCCSVASTCWRALLSLMKQPFIRRRPYAANNSGHIFSKVAAVIFMPETSSTA